MGIDVIESVSVLAVSIFALLFSLFRYIETPRRGWFLTALFFLTHLLSDYYWTIYTIVMGVNPSVSGFMAYFGWNCAFLTLFLLSLQMQNTGVRGYRHPLMFLPIPVNILQFLIYIRFGGILNNIWEVGFATAIVCICINNFCYYFKHKNTGAQVPYAHIAIFLYICMEFGMWTSSCYNWSVFGTDVFYYFAFTEVFVMAMLPWFVAKQYHDHGVLTIEKTKDEKHFQQKLQILVSVLLFAFSVGGYHVAKMMRKIFPTGSEVSKTNNLIAVSLFAISIVLAVMILVIIFMTAMRSKKKEDESAESGLRRDRFNLVFTIFVTLCLMIFSVGYTSRLFYRVSVTEVLDDGEEKAASTAADLENYLAVARSILWATADTVDLMIKDGASQDEIRNYIVDQTTNQKLQFDENFTGLYAYVNGEYMDGSGWIPPADFDPEVRDWYHQAVDAGGDVIIVSPYVDMQTKEVVITICKLLDDGGKPGDYHNREVVALDMVVNHVQEVTEEVDVSGKGYGMVVGQDGMIVAHHNPSMNGKYVTDIFDEDILDDIKNTKSGYIKGRISGADCTLFMDNVIDQWYIVVIVPDEQLFEDVYSQLFVNILVSLIIFLLISFFYYLGYRSEQINSKKVEELNINRQKQEYEAQVLKQKKEAADEANKAKSRFLADMSHEIRTPINAILGMNEMVLRETNDAEVLEYSDNIRVSGQNLLQLINSILDFSKIEDGKMEIVPVNYEVTSSITYLINSIDERAHAKGLEFITNIDETLPSRLYGDDTRINQVVNNLLTNAVKYTPEGTVTMTIEAKQKVADKILIYFEVKDTGMGIRKEDMDKLFESFERLDVTRNRNIEGTGLGMSIVTKLLALMDSKLSVESEYGRGSVFSFEIWQKIEDEKPIGKFTMTHSEPGADVSRGVLYAPDAKVLIVDDTRMNVLVATKLLQRTKVITDTASSGPEAIGLCEKTKYDVILLDQRMPKMDGVETLKIIKAAPDKLNYDTPVICLTADAIRGARERLIADGFTDYLSKPVDGKTLEEMLKKYLPEELIETVPAQAHSNASEIPEEDKDKLLISALDNAGVNTDEGISIALDDMKFYRQLLASYAGDFDERTKKLKEYYKNNDWKNYSIYIHSLKSSSKTIGATKLYDIAARLEKAAKNNDETTILAEHDRVISMYQKIVSAIYKSNQFNRPDEDTTS